MPSLATDPHSHRKIQVDPSPLPLFFPSYPQLRHPACLSVETRLSLLRGIDSKHRVSNDTAPFFGNCEDNIARTCMGVKRTPRL